MRHQILITSARAPFSTTPFPFQQIVLPVMSSRRNGADGIHNLSHRLSPVMPGSSSLNFNPGEPYMCRSIMEPQVCVSHRLCYVFYAADAEGSFFSMEHGPFKDLPSQINTMYSSHSMSESLVLRY
eukprot:Blabericola_migrator_1__3303@NODE_1973_length_3483_cov_102_557377_g1256_i0_p3_GENE_NODE_1973_length_3483_cov_102_557377_g1256_i0NODE_1973_length_3483_cov_102_557377_g1256_i0_p3_ORF_typecomplete_len126_score2_73_NODE_1973_length_3483_cov_102_557377_g1256_i013501727